MKSIPSSQAAVANSASALLCKFVEDNAGQLLGILRSYVRSARLVQSEGVREEGNPVQRAAEELLNDVLVIALERADRFDSSRKPMAWLLGIAANVIKRKQVASAKRYEREEFCSDEEMFVRMDRMASRIAEGQIEARVEAERLIAHVPEDDARVLRMYWLEGMDGNEIASALCIKPAAARQRLSRAMKRLREALPAQIGQRGGESNE